MKFHLGIEYKKKKKKKRYGNRLRDVMTDEVKISLEKDEKRKERKTIRK